MADGTDVATPTPETVTPGDSKTTVQPQAPTQGNASDPAEVERLRKEAQQQTMRANQLQKELEARQKSEQEARQKQLEENEQFKDLWEKEKAEKEALISERETARRKAELEAETNNLFKDYPPAVQKLATTAGLSLNDDSDEAKAELKTKLDTFTSEIGAPRVEANNPPPAETPTPDREQAIKAMRMNNIPNSARQAATKKAVSGLDSIKTMKAQAGIPETL
jgi:hypothetical protein